MKGAIATAVGISSTLSAITPSPVNPDLYQTDVDAPVDYIKLEGTTERAKADQGDQGMHRIIFPFLKAVLLFDLPFARLARTPPFRVGVQMKERLFEEFWTVKI